MFTSLASERFIRFGVTVLMDTFIALIVLKPTYNINKQPFLNVLTLQKV